MRIYSLALCAVIFGSPAFSQPLVEPGTCELIVASRPNFSAARAYIRANIQDTRFTRIFKSSNGWYAISIGSLRSHEEKSVMQNWKASGRIPQDSLCSRGQKYLAEYNWRDGSLIASADSNVRQSPQANTQQRTNSQKPRGSDQSVDLGVAVIGGILGLVFGGGGGGGGSSSNTSSNRQCGIDWLKADEPNSSSDYRIFSGGCNGGAFAGNWTPSGGYNVTGPGGRNAFGSDRSDVILRACGCY
ncbi:MAG: hypothetical protein ACXIUW_17010 [Roseinatronobacter sp.]